MKIQLLRRNGDFPPAGYEFIDPRTGFKIGGTNANFNDTVTQIIQHRLANPKVYPPSDMRYLETNAVGDELDAYTCARLGNNPRYCKDMDERKAFIPTFSTTEKPANACPKCQTCAGNRILSWICDKCGFERPK